METTVRPTTAPKKRISRTGRVVRVISARVRLSGRTDKPKSEILTIEEFERRAKDGTL